MDHRIKFETFLEDFNKLYQHILDSSDQTSRNILENISSKAAMFGKLNLILGICASSCFVAYPLVAGLRDLPYGIYIPNVNYRNSPTYEVVFFIQAVITFSGSLLYIPFSNLLSSFVMFGIVLIKILSHKISVISGSGPGWSETEKVVDHSLIEKRFKLLIENHKRIIRYVKEINELVSTVCLVELIFFGLLLSALLFLVNVVQKTSQLIMALSYIFLIMVQLFSLYWNSNELLEEVRGFAFYFPATYYRIALYLFICRRATTSADPCTTCRGTISTRKTRKRCSLSSPGPRGRCKLWLEMWHRLLCKCSSRC